MEEREYCPKCNSYGTDYTPGIGLYCYNCNEFTLPPREELNLTYPKVQGYEWGEIKLENDEILISLTMNLGDYPNIARVQIWIPYWTLETIADDAAERYPEQFIDREDELDESEAWKQT